MPLLLSYNMFSLFVGHYFSLTSASMSFHRISSHFHVPVSELCCGSMKILCQLSLQKKKINSRLSMTKPISPPLTSNTSSDCGFYFLAINRMVAGYSALFFSQNTSLQLIRANIVFFEQIPCARPYNKCLQL